MESQEFQDVVRGFFDFIEEIKRSMLFYFIFALKYSRKKEGQKWQRAKTAQAE